MRLSGFLVSLLLVACSGGKEDPSDIDKDGDGYSAALDCDDKDPTIHPGATEICDGIDQNCVLGPDDGTLVDTYFDGDGDGYGVIGAEVVQVCRDEAVGLATIATDCDDSDDSVHPDAEEDCDAVDRNCDGELTEGSPGLEWFRDSDGDGFGNREFKTLQCEEPLGYVLDNTDCNDTLSEINPAAIEICNLFDDDCDGLVNNDIGENLFEDLDGDGFGNTAVPVFACPAVGLSDRGGDCDDGASSVNPGATDYCNGGVDDDCDPLTDENLVSGTEYYADLDGDGFGDLNNVVLSCDEEPGLTRDRSDCDDTDSDVNPQAAEVCGGGDEDCDGLTDINATDGTMWYPDNDGDGFHGFFPVIVACVQPEGHVETPTDCIDTDPTAYPGAIELCDGGVDNDCDPTTNDDNSPNALPFYIDADEDGFGDPSEVLLRCIQPDDRIADGTDCDDTNPLVNPAQEEICDDLDTDCDPTTDEDLLNVWYYDQDQDGYGRDDVAYTGCEVPEDYVFQPGDCDDEASYLNPTDTPDCIQDHCGIVSASETWRNTVGHTISCDVVVEGGAKPVLTLQDGIVVEFSQGTGLTVGDEAEGALVIDGHTEGVTMTSGEAIKNPGDWNGVVLGEYNLNSVLTNLTVEYGGLNGLGGVTVFGDPEIVGLISQNNVGAGLRVLGGEPLVYNSQLLNNSDAGLFVEEGAGLARLTKDITGGPSFENNIISGNGGFAVTIPGSHADELAPSSSFVGNENDEIQLLSGILKFQGTWYDHDMPYTVATDAQIYVEDGPNAVLTINNNVDVLFGQNSGLVVGGSALGKLQIADGAQGVLFSATPEVVALSNNWSGVVFGEYDADSVLSNLIIEYGGANGKGNIWINNSSPTLDGVVSQYSDSAGLYIDGVSAEPQIQNSEFAYNDTDGVYVESSSGLLRYQGAPSFSGNTLQFNGGASIVLPPSSVGELDISTSFNNNGERISIHGGEVSQDSYWRQFDAGYRVMGDLFVGGPQDPELEIEAGAAFYFNTDTSMQIGLSDDGALLIDAVSNPVLMQSSSLVPGEGDWYGLLIGQNGPTRSQSTINGLVIDNAGGSDLSPDGGALELRDAREDCESQGLTQVLENVEINGSSKYGLYADDGVSFSGQGLVVTGALEGMMNIQPTPSLACLEANIVDLDIRSSDSNGNSVVSFGVLNQIPPAVTPGDYPEEMRLVGTDVAVSVVMSDLGVRFVVEEEVSFTASLTIEGIHLYFDQGAGLISNGGIINILPGSFLDSVADVPGYWNGIFIQKTSELYIDGATFNNAGNEVYAAAIALDRKPIHFTINNTTIQHSTSCGIVFDDPLEDYELDPFSYISMGAVTFIDTPEGEVCELL